MPKKFTYGTCQQCKSMTKINIPNYQLNKYLSDACPCFDGAKSWQRIDVGDVETYVGDGTFVIAILKDVPADKEELDDNCQKVQPVIIRYLTGEGFISEEYLYMALQEFDLQNPPDWLNSESDTDEL